mgnify:CR=1 FL=1
MKSINNKHTINNLANKKNETIFAPFTTGFMKRILLKKIKNIDYGFLSIVDKDETYSFGNSSSKIKSKIIIKSSKFYSKIFSRGSMGATESYIDGDWACDNLVSLCQILIKNKITSDNIEKGFVFFIKPLIWIFMRLTPNTKFGSKKNIIAHYDLSNEFFKLFLDKTMAYSCAYFNDINDSLEDAQVEKFDRLCRKLNINQNDKILEIGSGWGGFAIHAVSKYKCHVTTTTISDEQYEYTYKKIKKLGLENKITLLKKDYRDLNGKFDKIISIEMIEAVGSNYVSIYLNKCDSLLKSDGMMAIQGITINDQGFESYVKGTDFLRKYIFPGGSLISISQITKHLKNHTKMKIVHLEDISLHYAKTLNKWRENFFNKIDDVRSLGFSQNFINLWDFYLASCEAAFLEQHTGDYQIVFSKPDNKTFKINY